jgi:hypothetical protein
MVAKELPSTCTDKFWLRVRRLSRIEAAGAWTGKWLLYVPAEEIDERWPVIAGATIAGQLGIGAKVSTAAHPSTADGKHVICVYTADCQDREDVTQVLTMLRALGYGDRLSYKEDGATFAGRYGRGAALYVAQAGSNEFDQRREPLPVPPEHLRNGHDDRPVKKPKVASHRVV